MDEIRKARPKCIVNLLGIYGGTIFTPQSNPYFLNELEKYIQQERYRPADYWRALPEGVEPDVEQRYQRVTAEEVAVVEARTGRKIPTRTLTVVLWGP
jgi:hypothetical protein